MKLVSIYRFEVEFLFTAVSLALLLLTTLEVPQFTRFYEHIINCKMMIFDAS